MDPMDSKDQRIRKIISNDPDRRVSLIMSQIDQVLLDERSELYARLIPDAPDNAAVDFGGAQVPDANSCGGDP